VAAWCCWQGHVHPIFVLLQLVVQLGAARVGVTVVSIDPSVGVKGVEYVCVVMDAVDCGLFVRLSVPGMARSVLKSENCRGLVFSERYNGEHRAAALHSAIPEIDATLPGKTFASKRLRSMRHVVSTGFDAFEGAVALQWSVWCGVSWSGAVMGALVHAGMNYYREFPMAGDLVEFDAAVAAVSDSDVALVQYVPANNADGVSRGKEFTQKVRCSVPHIGCVVVVCACVTASCRAVSKLLMKRPNLRRR
jgi:hypothetical protein